MALWNAETGGGVVATRSLCAVASLWAAACVLAAPRAVGQSLDRFGGWTGLQGHNTSGYFRTEKINGRWWLITPDNNVFWSMGPVWARYDYHWQFYCPALDYAPNWLCKKAKFNNALANWSALARTRNAAWGFNTMSVECSHLANTPECLRFIAPTAYARGNGCRMVADWFADVFDPKFESDIPQRRKTAAHDGILVALG